MSHTPKDVGKASEMEVTERYCTCCNRTLRGKVAWLELDQRDQTYHDFGGVPQDKSQGAFPFGMWCAKKLLKAAALAEAQS